MLAERPPLPLFAYGTLLEPEFVGHLLERKVAWIPGRLLGYRVAELPGLGYPVVVEAEESWVDGRLYYGLTREDYRRLDAYEGVEEELYRRVAAHVTVTSEDRVRAPEQAYVYVPTRGAVDQAERSWSRRRREPD